jgi:excisionase family DNA binding protein
VIEQRQQIFTFTPREVAKLYSVSVSTIVRRIKDEHLPAIITISDQGKPHYRISAEVLKNIINDQNLLDAFTADIIIQRQIEAQATSARKLREKQKRNG